MLASRAWAKVLLWCPGCRLVYSGDIPRNRSLDFRRRIPIRRILPHQFEPRDSDVLGAVARRSRRSHCHTVCNVSIIRDCTLEDMD
jgi:hypothetical protein